jgi:branched-chain amino acid transport system ATP-binding protein
VTSPVLEVRCLTKQFGGLSAVKDVSFSVGAGEIVGLIGPNGAGKSTLVNLVSGVFKPTAGQVLLGPRDITWLSSYRRGRLGIARTFQLVRPFYRMTVLQNATLGALYGAGGLHRSMKQALERADEALRMTGLVDKRLLQVELLPVGDRRRLEIARAIAMDPKVLLLDEATAGLNLKEVEDAMGIMTALRASGLAIVLIEHVMKVIMGISDRVVVLHHGTKLAEGAPAEITSDDKVIRAYLGYRYVAGEPSAARR